MKKTHLGTLQDWHLEGRDPVDATSGFWPLITWSRRTTRRAGYIHWTNDEVSDYHFYIYNKDFDETDPVKPGNKHFDFCCQLYQRDKAEITRYALLGNPFAQNLIRAMQTLDKSSPL